MTSPQSRARHGPVVPALPPLDGVKDPAARQALQAVSDMMNVRNGNKGTGENRFLTEGDLKHLGVMTGGMFGLNVGGGNFGGSKPGGGGGSLGVPLPGQIKSMIDQLSARIYESPLFKAIGTNIDGIILDMNLVRSQLGSTITGLGQRIDERILEGTAVLQVTSQQFAAVNANVAAVQDTVSTMANTVSAVVDQSNRIEARVGNPGDPANPNGGLYSRLAQEAQTRANKDGALYAQYTVRIDQMGYVSGFGLSSTTSTAGTQLSEFYIRADRFAIAEPAGTKNRYSAEVVLDENGEVMYDPVTNLPRYKLKSEALPLANIPFIVQTSPWLNDAGVLQPAGCYIRSAYIQYAAIDTANIRTAAVDTLRIRGNAVTIPEAHIDPVIRPLPRFGGEVHIYRQWVNNDAAETIKFIANFVTFYSPGSGGDNNRIAFTVKLNGTPVFAVGIGYPNNTQGIAMPYACVIYVPTGGHWLDITARHIPVDVRDNDGTIDTTVGTVIGCKR